MRKFYFFLQARTINLYFKGAVRLNGLDYKFVRHYIESIRKVKVMYWRRAKGWKQLLKKKEDEKFEDFYLLKEKYLEYGALLADKRYNSVVEFLRFVTLRKKQKRQVLCRQEIEFNKEHFLYRILVKKVIGRMRQQSSLFSSKYPWSESMDVLFRFISCIRQLPGFCAQATNQWIRVDQSS